MRIILVPLFCLILTASYAQNLVPNPGFDVNLACPTQIGQIDKADGWSVWGGTPDYFHGCANPTHPVYGTPYNNRGYRTPRSGDAYVGLFTHTRFTANGREFIGRPLSAPLVVGTEYYVSMYVCRADAEVLGHATNNIGVRFSTVPFSLVNPDTALNNAHVWTASVISDTVNWIRISGSFVADSAYTHIGIGNYFSDSATSIIPGTSLSDYAYYLIDDVCVSQEMNVCGLSTSLSEEFRESAWTVFPNPSYGQISLKLKNNFNGCILIYDLIGKLIHQQEVNARQGEMIYMDLPESTSGIVMIVANGHAKRIQVVR